MHIRILATILTALFTACLGGGAAKAQKAEIKTNLLYWATSTPNVGFEWAPSERVSLSGVVGYNAFNFPNGPSASNPKLHHFLVMPEVKWWRCRTFERGCFGLHAIYASFNAGGFNLFSLIDWSEIRMKGNAYGGGVSYGYQWALGRDWGLELSIGVGYAFLKYSKYDCGDCGPKDGDYTMHYIGPTKAAVTFSYYIR